MINVSKQLITLQENLRLDVRSDQQTEREEKETIVESWKGLKENYFRYIHKPVPERGYKIVSPFVCLISSLKKNIKQRVAASLKRNIEIVSDFLQQHRRRRQKKLKYFFYSPTRIADNFGWKISHI